MKQIRFKVDEEVGEAIEKECYGIDKSKWLNGIMRERYFVKKGEGEEEGKKGKLEGKKLHEKFDNALMKAFEDKPGVLKSLDNETLAKLIAARIPKKENEEGEEREYLSLKGSMEKMTRIEDVMQELSSVKYRLVMREGELEVEKKKNVLIKYIRDGLGKEGIMWRMKEFLIALEERVNGHIMEMKGRSYDKLESISLGVPEELRGEIEGDK